MSTIFYFLWPKMHVEINSSILGFVEKSHYEVIYVEFVKMANLSSPIQEFLQTVFTKEEMKGLIVQQITSSSLSDSQALAAKKGLTS